MRSLLLSLTLLPGLAGCGTGLPGQGCVDPAVYHPDLDGDGLGDRDASYVGCNPPDGWITSLDTSLPPVDTSPPSDSSTTPPTDTSAPPDTSAEDTSTADTGVRATAAARYCRRYPSSFASSRSR